MKKLNKWVRRSIPFEVSKTHYLWVCLHSCECCSTGNSATSFDLRNSLSSSLPGQLVLPGVTVWPTCVTPAQLHSFQPIPLTEPRQWPCAPVSPLQAASGCWLSRKLRGSPSFLFCVFGFFSPSSTYHRAWRKVWFLLTPHYHFNGGSPFSCWKHPDHRDFIVIRLFKLLHVSLPQNLESFQPHLLKIVISSSLSSPLLWWLCISLNLLNHRLCILPLP